MKTRQSQRVLVAEGACSRNKDGEAIGRAVLLLLGGLRIGSQNKWPCGDSAGSRRGSAKHRWHHVVGSLTTTISNLASQSIRPSQRPSCHSLVINLDSKGFEPVQAAFATL